MCLEMITIKMTLTLIWKLTPSGLRPPVITKNGSGFLSFAPKNKIK